MSYVMTVAMLCMLLAIAAARDNSVIKKTFSKALQPMKETSLVEVRPTFNFKVADGQGAGDDTTSQFNDFCGAITLWPFGVPPAPPKIVLFLQIGVTTVPSSTSKVASVDIWATAQIANAKQYALRSPCEKAGLQALKAKKDAGDATFAAACQSTVPAKTPEGEKAVIKLSDKKKRETILNSLTAEYDTSGCYPGKMCSWVELRGDVGLAISLYGFGEIFVQVSGSISGHIVTAALEDSIGGDAKKAFKDVVAVPRMIMIWIARKFGKYTKAGAESAIMKKSLEKLGIAQTEMAGMLESTRAIRAEYQLKQQNGKAVSSRTTYTQSEGMGGPLAIAIQIWQEQHYKMLGETGSEQRKDGLPLKQAATDKQKQAPTFVAWLKAQKDLQGKTKKEELAALLHFFDAPKSPGTKTIKPRLKIILDLFRYAARYTLVDFPWFHHYQKQAPMLEFGWSENCAT